MSIASKCICGASLTYCNGSNECKQALNVQPPESSFDTSFYITLEKMDIDFEEVKKVCENLGCVVRVVDGDWQIEAPDPIKFFKLGIHMAPRILISKLNSIPPDERSVATDAS